MITRRGFLKSGGITLFGVGLGAVPGFLARAAAAGSHSTGSARKNVMVCIFQRGAMDGLMAVSPFSDPHLKAARPGLLISPAQHTGAKPLIDLDGKFGLHPSFQPLEAIFREKQLAIVHGIGSPNQTRSHFDAQDYMESGTPFRKGTSSGWLNRAAGLLERESPSPFQAVSLTSAVPRSLYGDNPCIAISNLQDFAIRTKGGPVPTSIAALSFEELYDQTSQHLLKETGKESFDAMQMLQGALAGKYQPAPGVNYPKSALGNALKQIAQLIKMDIGLEIAFAESGGWDTHFNQGTQNGVFARNAADLANCIAAFWTDLEVFRERVTVMTMTEFGRTVKQNGTGGTDHGRASCNFILGSEVNGGIVHGKIPELAIENLEDDRDLPVTTDFRAVFSEVAGAALGIHHNKLLFPEWNGTKIGVMKG
nr:DUF1501 domain-containing protein [uncultured Dyadobacter sp.]